MSLERLREVEIRLYKLTTKSHLTIGAGEASSDISAVDKSVIRAMYYDGVDEPKKIPYIPASSLHGVIRSWVEKALKSRPDDILTLADLETEEKQKAVKAFWEIEGTLTEETVKKKECSRTICNPLEPKDKCEPLGDETLKNKKVFFEAIGRSTDKSCPVCQIFGYMGQKGRVRFTHAFPKAFSGGDNLQLDIITRVAINRYTGAANDGSLFNLEAVPAGVEFYFFTIMENLDGPDDATDEKDKHKKKFELGIRAMNLQLASLGAHATVGFGQVEIKEEKNYIFDSKVFDLDVDAISIPDGYHEKHLKNLDNSKYPKFFHLLNLYKENGGDKEPLPKIKAALKA